MIRFDGNRPRPAQALSWALPLVRERAGSVAIVVLLSCLGSAAALLPPYLTQRLVDEGIVGGEVELVLWLCAAFLVLMVGGVLVETLSRLTYLKLSAHVLFGLREQVWRHLQTLAPTYYARTRGGEILSRLDGDVAEVQRFALDAPMAVLNGVFSLIVALVLMLSLSPMLTALVFALVPLQVAALIVSRPWLEKGSQALRKESAAMSSFFVESLRAMKFIQASNAARRQEAGLRAHHGDYFAALRRSQLASLGAGGLQRVLSGLNVLLVFAVGGSLAAGGELSVGVVVAFIAYTTRAAGPLQTLAGVFMGWQRAKVSLQRIHELAAERPTVASPAQPILLAQPVRGALRLDAVCFGYAAEAVLAGATLDVPAGTKLALVGASGAGKSTLIDLLQRHYDPQAGSLLLDGVRLDLLDLVELRRQVVVVDQEPVLMPGTVRDNLRFVAPDAEESALLRALDLAGLTKLAHAGGLDRPVGAMAAALSRGERLRLALARAILQDPAVLILDETTSGLDLPVAQAIMGAVDRVFGGRTRVVITHNLASVGAVDRVVELRDGRLVEPEAARPAAPLLRVV
ncbi:MAG: ATP-binding cassette, subfamily B, bacterial [Azoarcus sp.]|uniref:ATP-binding cassette, subfamily B n=1 Tax=Aromatoleum tolulyticum TaxID=34027 RepID=A0A1N6R4X0_9RHOO|nr:ABC transporter ATP-binding protein [Aromatoleum tolulyticum]MCK9984069.1 ATP-binding cassette, subfamily B, bacterial [Azoarcus sp.]SIQ23898.1 ATP-binding cassette, subfamily B [Aromatoleum tolulyticum]